MIETSAVFDEERPEGERLQVLLAFLLKVVEESGITLYKLVGVLEVAKSYALSTIEQGIRASIRPERDRGGLIA